MNRIASRRLLDLLKGVVEKLTEEYFDEERIIKKICTVTFIAFTAVTIIVFVLSFFRTATTVEAYESTIEVVLNEDYNDANNGNPTSEVIVEVEQPEVYLTQSEIEILARLLYGEANYGCVSEPERSMVIWCVLNRLDSGLFGSTVERIVISSGEFTGYHGNSPLTRENLALVNDVVTRWSKEKSGENIVDRTLPKEFLFFLADGTGRHNRFYRWSSGGLGATGDSKVWYDHTNPIANPYAA